MKRLPALHCLFALATLAWMANGCTSKAPDASPKVKFITIKSENVRAIVAPELGGRVMSLQFNNGANVLWTNAQSKTPIGGWQNSGGEKTWIGPQENWAAVGGRGWPPPDFADRDAFLVTNQTPTSISLLSTPDTNWNVRISRTIEALPDRLRVTSELLPTGPLPATRITNWSVAQLPPPQRLAVRLTGRKRFTNSMDDHTPLPEPVRLADDKLAFDFSHVTNNGKCSFDADLFLIDVPGGRLAIQQLGEQPEDDLLEVPERAQLYYGAKASLPPDCEPYIEVEFTRPHPASRQQIDYRFIPDAQNSH
ncbi:MAG: hypothetical protein ACOX9C_00385 [Kiritimatiellia bacterium]|jgi:hypothetical protein